MGFKKAILVLLLLIILTMGAASAADTNTTSDNLAATEDKTLELSENDDFEDKLGIESSNHISDTGNSTGKLTDLENVMSLTKDNHKEDKSYDDILSAQNDLNVLNTNYGTYSGLTTEIGSGGNIELNCDYYTYDSGDTITISTPNSVINGKGAIIDMAGSPSMRAFEVTASGVTIKNLTIKNANYTGDGGAIYFSASGNVTNCNFTGNTASYGGAIYFDKTGNVTNCNFTNNTARSGGAVYFGVEGGTVINCNFTNNNAEYGGAIRMGSGSVENCNFVDNTANYEGGAISMYSGSVENCNFVDNTANYEGGAINMDSGNVTNCNFTNNSASESGGAVYFQTGTVSNCNFTDNQASRYGGAIRMGSGNLTNCNFTNNKASGDYSYGGAVYFSSSGTVINCNFINNSASGDGGAVYFSSSGTVTNCNFINNSASGDGGAIGISSGAVENCNFTGNTANGGGAIHFENMGNGNVTNCNFTDNLANYGGAVCFNNYGNYGNVTNCNFTANTATYYGGAVWMSSGYLTNCIFINCSAENGGSFYLDVGNGMINTSRFDHSTATQNGGAIYWNADDGKIADSIFTNSHAREGGAIYVPKNNNVEIKSSRFENNHAEEGSGAVYGGTVDDDCTFEINTDTAVNTKTFISINETAVYTGNDILITTLILNNDKGVLVNTGTVEIYINSKLIATIPANTQYIHTTGEIGTYQVLAKFIDDSSYKGSSSTAEFTVIPVDIPEEIETSTAGIFTLEFPDDAEGTLTVFIDGTKYKVYDIIGGILKIDLSDKKGKYNITFEYSGDKNYPAFKKDANITVETNPSITASNAKVIYSAGTTYKITVYKNKGITANSVNIVIKQNNKKFKTIKTNSKGIASFKVTQTPGTYKLKITSLGKTVTKTLTVKHIVTLKTVKVKKSAKKLILQATLAKVNKKYLKKKTVTFKFNGKTYKAKTNAKGVAKVTIKSNVLKKLKVGKKITYQATYLKDTVKKTTKVKK